MKGLIFSLFWLHKSERENGKKINSLLVVSYFDEAGAAEAYRRLLNAAGGENPICLEFIPDPTEPPAPFPFPPAPPAVGPTFPPFQEKSAYSMPFPYAAPPAFPSFPSVPPPYPMEQPLQPQLQGYAPFMPSPTPMETEHMPSLRPSISTTYSMSENPPMLRTQPVGGLIRPEIYHTHTKSYDPAYFSSAAVYPESIFPTYPPPATELYGGGIAMKEPVGRVKFQETEESKAKYKISLPDILDGKDTRTTLMIKNIPNKYTQKMLLQKLDESHRMQYNFFYLPIDFKVHFLFQKVVK